MDLVVPHDLFDKLIDYFDTDSRFNIDARRYVKSDSNVVLHLSESGKNDSLVVDTPNRDRVTVYLMNDMTISIQDLIQFDKRI